MRVLEAYEQLMYFEGSGGTERLERSAAVRMGGAVAVSTWKMCLRSEGHGNPSRAKGRGGRTAFTRDCNVKVHWMVQRR